MGRAELKRSWKAAWKPVGAEAEVAERQDADFFHPLLYAGERDNHRGSLEFPKGISTNLAYGKQQLNPFARNSVSC